MNLQEVNLIISASRRSDALEGPAGGQSFGTRMRFLLTGAALVAALATAACGYVPARDDGPHAVAAPRGVTAGPACRVWDEDIFGRRYCRVRYVYGTGR